MKRLSGLAIMLLLSLSGCEKSDPALGTAPRIEYDRISAVAHDSRALQQLLTNTTHMIPMIGGNEYRYLGENGFAAIKGKRDERAVPGQWRIFPMPRGGLVICIGRGTINDDVNLADDRCASDDEFVGQIFLPTEGDPLGLATQAARP